VKGICIDFKAGNTRLVDSTSLGELEEHWGRESLYSKWKTGISFYVIIAIRDYLEVPGQKLTVGIVAKCLLKCKLHWFSQ
jgi:hypothetical protein